MTSAIASGILLGGVYATVALGLSLVFGVLRLANMAHGALVVVGGYLAMLVQRHLALDPLLSLPLVMAALALAAYPLQRYLLGDLLSSGPQPPLVATFGLALIVEAILGSAFSYDSQALSAGYAASGVTLLGITVQTSYVIAFGFGAALCAVAHVVLAHTRVGVVVRGASADPRTAELLGVDVRRVHALTFAVAAAVAGAAGVMVGVTTSFTPTTGTGLLLIGFAVVVLGGIGSVAGTFLAALVLGVLQSIGTELFGGSYGTVVVYLTFFVVLTLRPGGLTMRRSMA
jgi:branched-chain amino acid transport system permease protein